MSCRLLHPSFSSFQSYKRLPSELPCSLTVVSLILSKAMNANQFFGPLGALAASNWIDSANLVARQQNRDEFMRRVHGMPHGRSPKYNEFFRLFTKQLKSYHDSPRPRMMSTPAHFFHLLDIIKDVHSQDPQGNPTLGQLVLAVAGDQQYHNPNPPVSSFLPLTLRRAC
jgi:hypothetical protein